MSGILLSMDTVSYMRFNKSDSLRTVYKCADCVEFASGADPNASGIEYKKAVVDYARAMGFVSVTRVSRDEYPEDRGDNVRTWCDSCNKPLDEPDSDSSVVTANWKVPALPDIARGKR
jgi:hypothetical protein